MKNFTEDFSAILSKIKKKPLPSISKGLDQVIDFLKITEIKTTIKFRTREEFNREMEISSDGFYVNRQDNSVWVSYIPDFSQYEARYNALPKYHLYNTCDTKSAPERYTYSSESSGLFWGDNSTRQARLLVCKKCLTRYNEVTGENCSPQTFDLEQFMTRINQYLQLTK